MVFKSVTLGPLNTSISVSEGRPMKPLTRTATFVPSQIGGLSQVPVSYNSTPGRRLRYDIRLCLSKMTQAVGVFLPLRNVENLDPLDELYPSARNLISIGLNTILIFNQLFFLLSLPFCLFAPLAWMIVYVVAFYLVNAGLCSLLNGTDSKIYPSVKVDEEGKFSDEFWIFMNGVATGRGWLQSNVDRLSRTFGRRVIGIHNPSDGLIFDLIQCLLQRNFCYSSTHVSEAYLSIKDAILDERIKKICFILHSQGGIEGGMIMDWLFAEIPRKQLRRLEIYTFGCAANHFNNPDYHSASARTTDGVKAHGETVGNVVQHIEHYANLGDFVSQIGVLNYTRVPNRYMGRLFLAPNSGHLLNQHYLHSMFKLGEDGRCADENAFMEMDVRLSRLDLDEEHVDIVRELNDTAAGGNDFGQKGIVAGEDVGGGVRGGGVRGAGAVGVRDVAFIGDVNKSVRPLVLFEKGGVARKLKVKHFSRLWLYRNGGSPVGE